MIIQRPLLALLLLLCAAPASAQAPKTPEPLGIALEGYSYPYPVQYLPLTLQGQDVRMAYMDVPAAGKANGRTVLLLHGKNFFGSYWNVTIRALSEAGYRVVVPDQVGFGKSSKPALDYSFHTLATNTKQLLDKLDIPKVVVVGHSMGGMLATRFARMFPEATTHLVLENPIGLEDYRFLVPWRSTEDLYRDQLGTTEESIRKYQKTYYVTWRPEFDEYVQIPFRQTLSAEYPRLAWVSAATEQMIYQQPVVHEFPLVTAPVLLVIGQADRTTLGRARVSPEALAKLGQYPELGKRAAKAFPKATLVEIPNVGHIPHFEAPEKWHQALLGFLGK
ncbi:alpha/beta fold hydrolase [Vitiosangium sp. GDMCC 1.1324]|uniref:alpha/beta fold hydrolase n=2 Tax=Vitiosangium sp. (strain GDMCC 1.1324) TaxID=2138576 RepID=UPI000D3540F9|nr:alpha/beta hydrolase [Vitiosangium sp. GDMCC 1.1324]PTL77211.1 alpha/beta hydrolase [Vitiosangium sp. GDMCC 1.1324]